MATGATDPMRARLRDMWEAVSGSWGALADVIDERAAAVTTRMLDATAPAAGERVLDLACGAGGTGLAAARRMGGEGEVVLTDGSEGMVRAAAARAAGLPGVTARVRDLEAIDEPDGAFDVVLCREGLMLVPGPARALDEVHRVLRPGGRLALAVWGPRERNPWLGVLFDAVAAEIGEPVPPPGVPGPFSLGADGLLAGLLEDAGFAGVRVEEVDVPLRAADAQEWWARSSALAGPLALRMAAMPEETRAALRARAAGAARAYEGADGLVMPGLSLVATATRATREPSARAAGSVTPASS